MDIEIYLNGTLKDQNKGPYWREPIKLNWIPGLINKNKYTVLSEADLAIILQGKLSKVKM